MRWSLKVVFKESKGNLGLGKYQMRNFSSQIAGTAITAMQYNILVTAKRFTDYTTIGGLFKEAVGNSAKQSVTGRNSFLAHSFSKEIINSHLSKQERLLFTNKKIR